MKILRSVLLPAAFAAAIALPAIAGAQQSTAPVAPPHGAMNCGAGMEHHGNGMNPMRGINLSPQQRAQIKALHEQFRAAHPCGSPPDPQARRQLRQQVMNVLTPQQRAQFEANMQQMHPRMNPGSTPQ